MKYTIKLLGIIAIVAVIGFSMTACDSDVDGDFRLVGTWVYATGDYSNSKITLKFNMNNKFYVFKSDNWGSADSFEYTWSTSGNLLTIDHDHFRSPVQAKYSISGKSLTISESSNTSTLFPATYTKQ